MAEDNTSKDVILPSYAVAYGQLQYLARAQTSLLVRFKCKADKQSDYVTREEYDDLKQQLEKEANCHLQTKSRLLGREKELEFALSDIEILSKQLKEEKNLFNKVYNELQSKAEEKSKENNVLLETCSEIKEVCGFQDNILTVKDVKINDLQSRLARQSRDYRMATSEAKLKLQQERFLNEQSYKSIGDSKNQQRHLKQR